MEENSLDSLITNSSVKQTAPLGNSPERQEHAPARPRLRKIKRPKIRPMVDIPPAPAKVMPEELASSDTLADLLNQPSDIPSDDLISEQPAENQAEETPVLEEDAHEELRQTHSLIRAVDASNVKTESTTGTTNPYVLDTLPPELNFAAGEETEEIYINDYIKKNIFYAISALCLFIGIMVGKAMFSSQTIEKHGLEGVEINPEVPAGRPRCGLTDRSQACVLYIMNCYKQDLNGRDFYKMAAKLTDREDYMIETENLRYATVKIKPGHFAQLNIPALK